MRYHAEFDDHAVDADCKGCGDAVWVGDKTVVAAVYDRTLGASADPVARCPDIVTAERIARLLNDEHLWLRHPLIVVDPPLTNQEILNTLAAERVDIG